MVEILSPLLAFSLGALHLLSAYLFVAKKKKFNFAEIVFFLSWLIGASPFFINGVMLFLFYHFQLPLEKTFFFIVLMFSLYFLQYGLILLYWIVRIVSRKQLFWFWSLFSLFLWAVFSFSFYNLGKNAKVGLRYGEPFLFLPRVNLILFSTGFFFLGLILLYFFLIWRGIKSGLISWNNLSLFYQYYSVIVLGAITFIRVFYFFPYPYILLFFYSLIPYLIYLSRKEELKRE